MAGKDDRIIKRKRAEEFQQIYQLAHHSFTLTVNLTDPKEVVFYISLFFMLLSHRLWSAS